MKQTITFLRTMYLLSVAIVVAIASSALAYDMQASNDNGVRVTVTPKILAQDQAAEFNVSLNTHSVELGQDLAAVAELRDDQGRSYLPSRWDGSPPGGHHRRGTLIFPKLGATVQSVTLIIRDIAQVPERSFTWIVNP